MLFRQLFNTVAPSKGIIFIRLLHGLIAPLNNIWICPFSDLHRRHVVQFRVWYSEIMADKQTMSHDLVTDYDFIMEANRLGLHGRFRELLVSVNNGVANAEGSFKALRNSPKHDEGMRRPNAWRIGCYRSVRNGNSYVTVYIQDKNEDE